MPKMVEKDAHIEIHYQKEIGRTFRLKESSIRVDVETSIPHDFSKRTLVVKQSGWLDLIYDNPVSLERAKDVFYHIEDLLVLLTDQECALEWPLIQTSNDSDTGTLFCTRRRPIKSEVSAFEFWIVLPQIIDHFGEIVDMWLEMRTKYGAALHLYLGIRRGTSVYVEHKFANFIWGLEALHRLVKPEKLTKSQFPKERLDEILKIIDRHQNSKERAKLSYALDGMHDRPLSAKLFELLSMLPLTFLDDTLKNFTGACADRRNDISHYGGPRNSADYDVFIEQLISLTHALDHLYHATILLQLGISDEVIHDIFYKNMKSTGIRTQLRWAGLKLAEPQPPPHLPKPLPPQSATKE